MPEPKGARLGAEVALLAQRVVPPTDDAVWTERPCPDCGYTIRPGRQHGRNPQPEGSSHVVCSLRHALLWKRLESPWLPTAHEVGETYVCGRCDLEVPPCWRHFWPTCRGCAVWSAAGQHLMFAFGLDGHPWLYWGTRPWCGDCHGIGFLPCQPQDLSIVRLSGNCQVCGAYSFKLIHATNEDHSDVEGSARHYDDVADHEVIVGAAPLVKMLDETFTRADAC